MQHYSPHSCIATPPLDVSRPEPCTRPHLLALAALAGQALEAHEARAAVELAVQHVQQAAQELLRVALLPIAPALIAQPRLLHEPAQPGVDALHS